jgi:hypothetical protein
MIAGYGLLQLLCGIVAVGALCMIFKVGLEWLGYQVPPQVIRIVGIIVIAVIVIMAMILLFQLVGSVRV